MERQRTPLMLSPGEIAPEAVPALPTLDIQPVSPRRFDRLNTFRNMVRAALDAKRDQQMSGAAGYFGRVVNGKVAEKYIHLNERYQATWNGTAARMYAQELRHDPELKECADAIVEDLKEEFDGPPAMSADQLRSLYDRSPSFEVDAENPWGTERRTVFSYEASEGEAE